MSWLHLFYRRHDLTEGFKKLQCKTLIFVGESSPFHAEALYMSTKMDKKSCALVEVRLSLNFFFFTHQVLLEDLCNYSHVLVLSKSYVNYEEQFPNY